MEDRGRQLVVGRISGLFGVRGWVKIYSWTEPRENILEYPVWLIRTPRGEWQPRRLAEGQRHGKGVIARLESVEDRDQAALLMGAEIAIPREELPELPEGEYYWCDLEGLAVETPDGVPLGRVQRLMETGANDVLVVRGDRERLIPWIMGDVIREVDLQSGRIVADWDPGF